MRARTDSATCGVPMKTPAWLTLPLLVLVMAAVALSAGPAFPARTAVRAAHLAGAPAQRTAAQRTAAQGTSCDPTASLRPAGPPRVTPGSVMARIRARGYLIAGVDPGTYHFGFLDPLSGQFEGFDIDMLHAIAKAIFGDPGKIEFKAIR